MNACEITVEELKALPAGSYQLIDIRAEDAFAYGGIDGAVNIPLPDIEKAELDDALPVILYCKSGVISLPLAEKLTEDGYLA